ncbi:YjhX family toxin [Rhizobium sp.]|uniref:YjhX family toxin n=1 Tax=Rhizobium sp. TaxID=391 RepID=UPI0028AE877B
MNTSKIEQRTLEILSPGGKIVLEKDQRNRAMKAAVLTREGWFLDASGLNEFRPSRPSDSGTM